MNNFANALPSYRVLIKYRASYIVIESLFPIVSPNRDISRTFFNGKQHLAFLG
jgi:hypothetical protein